MPCLTNLFHQAGRVVCPLFGYPRPPCSLRVVHGLTRLNLSVTRNVRLSFALGVSPQEVRNSGLGWSADTQTFFIFFGNEVRVGIPDDCHLLPTLWWKMKGEVTSSFFLENGRLPLPGGHPAGAVYSKEIP